ncbi:MAG: DNA ligase, partial [Gammaproteobacteria bacterium]|nr:DNA ligase [Gammaproteobacteria bacterium]
TQVLDGELWWQRGAYEKTVSIVNRHKPHQGWDNIRFMLFDAPLETQPFSARLEILKQVVQQSNFSYLQLIPQFRLASETALQLRLQEVVKQGGEGLMLHHQDALYRAGRSAQLLKLKPFEDAEAVVMGYRGGKGKYQGMVGSLQLRRSDGVTFYAGSGLSDQQRRTPPPLGSVVTYRYQGLTGYGKPRFPVFLHQRLLP